MYQLLNNTSRSYYKRRRSNRDTFKITTTTIYDSGVGVTITIYEPLCCNGTLRCNQLYYKDSYVIIYIMSYDDVMYVGAFKRKRPRVTRWIFKRHVIGISISIY